MLCPSLEPSRRGGSNDGSQNMFIYGEIWLIIPKLSQLPLLIILFLRVDPSVKRFDPSDNRGKSLKGNVFSLKVSVFILTSMQRYDVVQHYEYMRYYIL